MPASLVGVSLQISVGRQKLATSLDLVIVISGRHRQGGEWAGGRTSFKHCHFSFFAPPPGGGGMHPIQLHLTSYYLLLSFSRCFAGERRERKCFSRGSRAGPQPHRQPDDAHAPSPTQPTRSTISTTVRISRERDRECFGEIAGVSPSLCPSSITPIDHRSHIIISSLPRTYDDE